MQVIVRGATETLKEEEVPSDPEIGAPPPTQFISFPDGSVNVGIESARIKFSEVLCWNCHARIYYQLDRDQARCDRCGAEVDTSVNNRAKNFLVRCLCCETDLRVPKDCLHVCCGACGHIFRLPKNYYSKADYVTNIYEFFDKDD